METLRPGALILWQNDGPIKGKDRENNLKLIGSEVMPAIREFGKELSLTSAFEVKPGSRPLPSSASRSRWARWNPCKPGVDRTVSKGRRVFRLPFARTAEEVRQSPILALAMLVRA